MKIFFTLIIRYLQLDLSRAKFNVLNHGLVLMLQGSLVYPAICSQENINQTNLIAERPSNIQIAVDKAFQEVRASNVNNWHYRGEALKNLCRFQHEEYIKNLCKNAPIGAEIRYLDFGAGLYRGGAEIANVILRDKDLIKIMVKKNVTLELVGVSGEAYPTANISHLDGLIIERRYGGIKLENIIQELNRCSISFHFDVVFTRWTLVHLVDPLGTYQQLLQMTKKSGLLIFSGFYMYINSVGYSKEPAMFRLQVWSRLLEVSRQSGEFIQNFCHNFAGNQFDFIVRKVKNEVLLPYQYGEIILKHGYNASGIISNYSTVGNIFVTKEKITGNKNQYYGSQDLFENLKEFLGKKNDENMMQPEFVNVIDYIFKNPCQE